MRGRYHKQITIEALGDLFEKAALARVTAENLKLDGLVGQLWHPEYHFDNSKFREGWSFIEEQRVTIQSALNLPTGTSATQAHPRLVAAWRALGKLAHTAQDFYAHSSYIPLYFELNQLSPGELNPNDLDFKDEKTLSHISLRSGRFYFPLEVLSYIPFLEPLVLSKLPDDSHGRMNLDHPGRGVYFPFAYSAAVRRTRYEFDKTVRRLSPEALNLFTGRA
jgi:hypothetical protein